METVHEISSVIRFVGKAKQAMAGLFDKLASQTAQK
jgi:hypothetical protein